MFVVSSSACAQSKSNNAFVNYDLSCTLIVQKPLFAGATVTKQGVGQMGVTNTLEYIHNFLHLIAVLNST